MIARNELCPCGSGKKHKTCCGGPVDANRKTLTQMGMNRAFLFLIQSICQREEVGCVTLSRKDLESLPKDMALGVGHDPKLDIFSFKPVKVEEKPKILTPEKRIIT
jgi:hypothetical protein